MRPNIARMCRRRRGAAIRRATLAALAIALAGLAGCGNPRPKSDAPYLASFHLDQPIILTVSLQQPVDANGNLQNSSDLPIIALLMHVGALRAAPNAASSPWWLFSPASASVSGNMLSIPVGKRVVTGRSGEKSWTDQGADYFSETLAYTIKPQGPFASWPDFPAMNETVRLTLRRDSSNAPWRIWYGSDQGTRGEPDQDGPRLIQALAERGPHYEGELGENIQSARNAAFDQIERSFANRGLFKRDANDGHIIISPANNIAFYNIPYDLHGGSYTDAEHHCAGLNAGHYHWRLPTYFELHGIVGSDNRIIDVPDGRLWGAVRQSNPGQAILIVANTFYLNNGPALFLEQLGSASSGEYAWAQFLEVTNDGWTTEYHNPMDAGSIRTAPVTGGDPNYLVRVLCVASLPK